MLCEHLNYTRPTQKRIAVEGGGGDIDFFWTSIFNFNILCYFVEIKIK